MSRVLTRSRNAHSQGTRDIYDIVLKAIKLISPHPDYGNLFVTYLWKDQGQNLFLK
jgi:hypothetical protein